MLDVEQQTYVMIPLDKIVKKLSVRKISKSGKNRILKSMQKSGFLNNYPLIVIALPDKTYLLIDGNHRLEVARELGVELVPCVIKTGLTELEQYKLALDSNNAAETIVPSTLVTFAEFIWDRTVNGYTHEEVGKILGWGTDKVDKYNALRQIDSKAWAIIPPTFDESVDTDEECVGGSKPPTVGFTEGLLRSILDLTPEQQLELVQAFAHPNEDKRISKGKFKTQAENYKARNDASKYACEQLGNLGETYTNKLIEAIYSGAYDDEWKASQDAKKATYGKHPKLDKLIQSLQGEWEQKNSIHLKQGDFYKLVKEVGNASIDLILTDPPYNIANKREFTMAGRSNISQDFGQWDKYDRHEFIALFDIWASEWKRILRDNGCGYVFTSDIYISYLRSALEKASLCVKSAIVWHKTNPPTQFIKTTFRSTVEYLLFFTKSESEYTFNWLGDKEEMHNFLESGVCGGNERLSNAKGNTLHPTQKPEQILRHLIEISSNRGDMVFDGFAGVGSSGKAAKDLGRKFIGFEQDEVFFKAMQRRLGDD